MMNKFATVGVLLCALVALSGAGGCDGTDKGGGGSSFDTKSSPPEQCRAVSRAVCVRERECLKSEPSASCTFDLDAAGLCAGATAATASVSSCYADIQSLSCASLFARDELDLPAACSGAFTFAKSEAEKQCEALAAATCARIVACSEEPVPQAEQAAEVAACTAEFIEFLECFAVTGVTPSFATCLQKTESVSCAVFAEEGVAECAGVLQ